MLGAGTLAAGVVLALRDAQSLAPMTDSTRRIVADLVAIDARAAALGVRL